MVTVDLFSALLTPVIAIVTTIILVQQYRIEKRSFKFQLYNQRHAIYDAVMKFVSSVVIAGQVNNEDLNTFMKETRDCNFFFNEEVTNYIDSLYKKAIKLIRNDKMIASGKVKDAKHEELCNESFVIQSWFSDQYPHIKNLFQDYLNFTKL